MKLSNNTSKFNVQPLLSLCCMKPKANKAFICDLICSFDETRWQWYSKFHLNWSIKSKMAIFWNCYFVSKNSEQRLMELTTMLYYNGTTLTRKLIAFNNLEIENGMDGLKNDLFNSCAVAILSWHDHQWSWWAISIWSVRNDHRFKAKLSYPLERIKNFFEKRQIFY